MQSITVYAVMVVLLCIANDSYSQLVDPALICDDATIMCSMDDQLDGFASTMPDANPSDDPNPLCPGLAPGGTPQNLSWFAFVAGSFNVTLNIDATNCNGTNPGIQYGVYTDCSFDEWVVCDPECNDANFDIVMTGLDIGDDYFIFLDGCFGSVCDYTVTVVEGGQFDEIDEPADMDIQCVSDCTEISTSNYEICQGADDIEFSFINFDLSIEYTWVLTDVLSSTMVSTDVVDGLNNIKLSFDDLGTFQLCASGYNGCDDTEDYCLTIEVVPYPDEVFDEMEVCANVLADGVSPVTPADPNLDGIGGWEGPDITAPGLPVMYEAETNLGCIYTQEVNVIELPLPNVVEIDTAICLPGGSVTIGGYTYNSETEDDDITALSPAANGCDSNMMVTVYTIKYDLEIIVGDCSDFGIELHLDIDIDNLDSETGMETNSWVWTLDGNPIMGSEDELYYYADTDIAGTYSVDFIREILGVECQTFAPEIEIDPEDFAPVILPDLPNNFDLTICYGEETGAYYALDVDDYPHFNDLDFYWQVDCGSIVVGQGTQAISVDFTGCTTAMVCYQVENSCAIYDGLCYEVVFTENPVPTIEPVDTLCVGDQINIKATPVLVTAEDIDWDFGSDASIITTVDIDEYTVSWDTPGTKTVSLEVDYGCASDVEHSIEVEVIEDPEITGLACLGSGGNLAIDWDDLPGLTDYDITVIQGDPGTLNGSQYVFGDLEAGDVVEIQISIEGDCGLILADTSCVVPECLDVALVINHDYQGDTICLDGSVSMVNFSAAETLGVPGMGEFSGNGIIDMTTGVFDPTAAGPGTHTITYVYSFQDGLCGLPIDTMITVVQEPVYNITVSPDTVCVGDPVNITIGGDYGNNGLPNVAFGSDFMVIDNPADGQYIVSWSSAGIKNILADVEIPGCGPYQESSLVVVETLAPLTISCEESTSSVVFSWNDEDEYDGYQISINGMLVDTIFDNTFTEGGLPDGTDVEIEIFPLSNNSCDAGVFSLPCRAQDCTSVPLTIEIPGDSLTVCVFENYEAIQLTANYDASLLGGGEYLEWSEATNGVDGNGLFTPNNGPGNYTIDVKLIEDNCEYTQSVSFLFEEVPSLAIASDKSALCIDDSLVLSYHGDDLQDYSFQWTGLPSTADLNTTEDQIISFDIPGLYLIELNASSSNCLSEQASFEVEVVDSTSTPMANCNPGVDIIELDWTVEDSDCNGTFYVYVDGDIVSTQDTTGYTIQNLDAEQEVIIEIINENDQCICPEKITVLDCTTLACPNTSITINLPDTTLCSDDVFEVLDLDVIYDETVFSDFVVIEWSGDNIDLDSGIFDPNIDGAGSYDLMVSLSDGPCDFNASIMVIVEEVPVLSLVGMDTICIEDNWMVNYDGEDLSGYTINWTSSFMEIDQETVDPLSIQFDEPGNYELVLNANSASCEAAATNLFVEVLDSVRTAEINCIAYTDSIVFSWNVDFSACNGSFLINADYPGFPITTDETSLTLEALPETYVAISVTTLNDCLCPEKISLSSCTTLPCPSNAVTIESSSNIYCLDEFTTSIQLDAKLNGASINSGINWIGTNIDQNGLITIDENIEEGIYEYAIEYSENVCVYENLISIEFVKPARLEYRVDQPECPGDDIGYLNVLGFIDLPNNVYFLDGQEIDPNQIHQVKIGISTLEIVRKGICNSSESFTVDVPENIDFEILGLDVLPHNESVEFSIEASNPSAIDSIVWEYLDTVVISNTLDLTLSSFTELCATVHYNDLCEELICRKLSLEANQIFIPNVFRPANDDENGLFNFKDNGFVAKVNHMKIYDRWGNMVHSVEDVLPDDVRLNWDGSFNGKPLVQGVYVYVIDLEFNNGRGDYYIGDVTLIR